MLKPYSTECLDLFLDEEMYEQYPELKWGDLRFPSDVTVKRAGDQVVVKRNKGVSFKMPASILDKIPKGYVGLDRCEFCIGKKSTLIVMFSVDAPDTSPIICVDSSTGKINWRAELWGAGGQIGGGFSSNCLQLSCNESTAIIFGLSTTGAYAETFDLKTGKPVFRFSTNYWSRWISTQRSAATDGRRSR